MCVVVVAVVREPDQSRLPGDGRRPAAHRERRRRPADEVERADAALVALAAQRLSTGSVTEVYIYTTDVAAGDGTETVLARRGTVTR